MSSIGVGLIGANPDYGWGFRAHVPAIAAVDGVHVAAVATTRDASARRAAELTGAGQWYTDPDELSADPDVDLVVVSVKVPTHDRLVRAAIAAGKHVLCEWPLAASTAEAVALDRAATAAGVQGFVGLQARMDPVVEHVRDIVEGGGIGSMMAVSVRSSVRRNFDDSVDSERAYTLDATNAAGNVEVQGGHLLDLIDHIVGGIDVTSARTALHRNSLRVQGTDQDIIATSPDVFGATIAVGDGGLGTVLAWYGDPRGGTELVLQGTRGRVVLSTLPVTEGYAQQPQMAPFTAQVITASGSIDLHGPADRLPVQVENVARTYRRIVGDLADGTISAPRFVDAVRIHRMLDVVRSGATPHSLTA